MSAKRQCAECAAPPTGPVTAPAAAKSACSPSPTRWKSGPNQYTERQQARRARVLRQTGQGCAAGSVTAGASTSCCRTASQRYRLMRTHEWNDEVIERLSQEPR